MSSETTMMAEQYRLREWADQIRDCQSRPSGMSVVSWCACHGITSVNTTFEYYCEVMDENEQIITFMNNTFIPEGSASKC